MQFLPICNKPVKPLIQANPYGQNYIDKLPPETLLLVLEWLSYKKLEDAAAVCWRWNMIVVDHTNLWNQLIEKAYKDSLSNDDHCLFLKAVSKPFRLARAITYLQSHQPLFGKELDLQHRVCFLQAKQQFESLPNMEKDQEALNRIKTCLESLELPDKILYEVILLFPKMNYERNITLQHTLRPLINAGQRHLVETFADLSDHNTLVLQFKLRREGLIIHVGDKVDLDNLQNAIKCEKLPWNERVEASLWFVKMVHFGRNTRITDEEAFQILVEILNSPKNSPENRASAHLLLIEMGCYRNEEVADELKKLIFSGSLNKKNYVKAHLLLMEWQINNRQNICFPQELMAQMTSASIEDRVHLLCLYAYAHAEERGQEKILELTWFLEKSFACTSTSYKQHAPGLKWFKLLIEEGWLGAERQDKLIQTLLKNPSIPKEEMFSLQLFYLKNHVMIKGTRDPEVLNKLKLITMSAFPGSRLRAKILLIKMDFDAHKQLLKDEMYFLCKAISDANLLESDRLIAFNLCTAHVEYAVGRFSQDPLNEMLESFVDMVEPLFLTQEYKITLEHLVQSIQAQVNAPSFSKTGDEEILCLLGNFIKYLNEKIGPMSVSDMDIELNKKIESLSDFFPTKRKRIDDGSISGTKKRKLTASSDSIRVDEGDSFSED